MQPNYTQEEVLEELQTVLHDAKFAAAPQMSAFLKFVVLQTLEGKADRIKAYTVAVDALGKPATFDPQNDPSVRVLAKRLRDTLSAYYERTSGHKVVLLLKSGSYVPKFVSVEEWRSATKAVPNNVMPIPSVVANDERPSNDTLLFSDKERYAKQGKVSGDTLESLHGLSNKSGKP